MNTPPAERPAQEEEKIPAKDTAALRALQTETHGKLVRAQLDKTSEYPALRLRVLTGQRPDADPFEDGAMHEVQTYETSFGILAMTTGPGIPKSVGEKYFLNRDAIGYREHCTGTNYVLLRIAVADGVGLGKDSGRAAEIAVNTIVNTPIFSEGPCHIEEAIIDTLLAPTGSTCLSALELRREGEGYRLSSLHAGDTNIIALRNGRVVFSLPPDNAGGFVEDIARRSQSNNEEISEEDLERLREITERYPDVSQLPRHVISACFKAYGSTFSLREKEQSWNALPGDLILCFTDGIQDNCSIEHLAALVAQAGEGASCEALCQAISAFCVQKMKSYEKSAKQDNIALGILRLA